MSELITLQQTIDRLEALPTCQHYKGTDCGPWCHCRTQEDALQILQTWQSDLRAVIIAAFVSGLTTGGILWLLWISR